MRCMKSLLVVIGLLSLQQQGLAQGRTLFDKQAHNRDNYACAYYVNSLHELYRRDRGQGDDCSGAETLLKSNVVSLKIPGHPDDSTATAYFVRAVQGRYELWYVDEKGEPRVFTHVNLKKGDGKFRYSLVDNHKSKAVLFLLTKDGVLEARDTVHIVNHWDNIVDYRVNPKFGKDGAPYSSYIVFALTSKGNVVKIKGTNPSKVEVDARQYKSLQDFCEQNGVKLN